jgi:hypothetical protein
MRRRKRPCRTDRRPRPRAFPVTKGSTVHDATVSCACLRGEKLPSAQGLGLAGFRLKAGMTEVGNIARHRKHRDCRIRLPFCGVLWQGFTGNALTLCFHALSRRISDSAFTGNAPGPSVGLAFRVSRCPDASFCPSDENRQEATSIRYRERALPPHPGAPIPAGVHRVP